MTSTQQRAALQSQIWKIANDVRGAVDGWDFKQYFLGTLFYREVVDITRLNAELKTTVAKIDRLRANIGAIVGEIEGA